MVEQTVAAFGRLDTAYNNAGVQKVPLRPLILPREDYERVMAINLRGVWSCMKFELQQMRQQGSGAIVNCSSLGGLVGLPARRLSRRKTWSDRLHQERGARVCRRGIRVNAVCPGCIDTPMGGEIEPAAMQEFLKMQPIGRMGRPEEVAAAVLWLCSPAASMVLGVALPVDGGFVAH